MNDYQAINDRFTRDILKVIVTGCFYNIRTRDRAFIEKWRATTDGMTIERAMAIDPVFAFAYAMCVVRERFELGEPILARNAGHAYYYAKEIIKDRWPEGEPAIATDPGWAHYYAQNVLKGRFELGEPAIATDPYHAREYSIEVLKDRWPEGEPAIFSRYNQEHYFYRIQRIQDSVSYDSSLNNLL